MKNMDDRHFRQLLEYSGLSRQGYRKVRKGVKKRVGRHMQRIGCRSMREYLEQLRRSAEDRRQCELMLTVPISRYFRDPRLWQVLESQILPELVATHQERIGVWSAGCACGEEVYSLKILWEHMGRSVLHLPVLDITATDLNPRYLARAEEALYPLSSLKEVPQSLKAAYFQAEPGGRRFKLEPALKEGITWLTHDFFSGPPGFGFHLIFIRNNLLTYYPSKRTLPLLEAALKALCVGGYLILGSHEKLPFQSPNLQPCPSLPCVFKKGP
jgi:chemotaxis methyl-accepting protein methylase